MRIPAWIIAAAVVTTITLAALASTVFGQQVHLLSLQSRIELLEEEHMRVLGACRE